MALLNFSGKFIDPRAGAKVVKQSLRKTLADCARESCFAVRRSIPRNFHLRRDWIVRGIRYEVPKGDELKARVLSLDRLLEKHEGGALFHEDALVQSRFLQDKGRGRSERPRDLRGRKNFFIAPGGIFERIGRHKLRTWYVRAHHRDYAERLKMLEAVNRVVLEKGRTWKLGASLAGPPWL